MTGKNIFYLLMGFISIIMMLNGCASKHTQSSPEIASIIIPGNDSDSLTPKELAVLHSEGQVDKNIPNSGISDIALQYKYYLRKGRQSMCVVSKRSEQYLAYAKKVFRSRGMPEELANLAIVESGYRPNAVSSAGAAGAWQFMPATGAKYGLTQDEWQDERLDPYRATEAAADYLQTLYSYFGDWPTAIAAYNAGEGKMSRAKAGTGGKDFFEVKDKNHLLDDKTQLREETRQYVPKFLAVTKIMRNLPELGFEAIEPENAESVQRLTVAPGTDLNALSKACALSWQEFALYNPHHKRTISCTDKKTFVYLPTKAQTLAANYLNSANQRSYAGWKLAKVSNNSDSLEKISKRTQVSLALIKAANPGIGRLRSGQVLVVPPTAKMSAALNNSKAARHDASMAKTKSGKTHKVQKSETLYSISRKYNVDLKDLLQTNNLTASNSVQIGRVLNIPAAKTTQAPATGKSSGRIGKNKSYTVQPKDNLWRISRKHNVSVADLQRWNNISNNNLKPGTQIIVAQE